MKVCCCTWSFAPLSRHRNMPFCPVRSSSCSCLEDIYSRSATDPSLVSHSPSLALAKTYQHKWARRSSTAQELRASSSTQCCGILGGRNQHCTRTGSLRPRRNRCLSASRSGVPARSCTVWRWSAEPLQRHREETMGKTTHVQNQNRTSRTLTPGRRSREG